MENLNLRIRISGSTMKILNAFCASESLSKKDALEALITKQTVSACKRRINKRSRYRQRTIKPDSLKNRLRIVKND